jgi:hypothetical protein
MNLDMACVDHQPFKISFVYQRFQQTLPNAFVSPSAKAPVRILPIAVIWWQIPPGCACTKNPEHCIDELPVVAGVPSPCSLATKQPGLQKIPYVI